MICRYNLFMGGMDKLDQFLSYYNMARNTARWWKTGFFWLVDLCIIKSMCIYFEKHPHFAALRNPHKKYRELLVHELGQPNLDFIDATKPTRNSAAMAEPKSFCCNATAVMRLVGKQYISRHPVRRNCSLCAYEVNWKEKEHKSKWLAKNVKFMFATTVFMIFILKAASENNLHCLKVLGSG